MSEAEKSSPSFIFPDDSHSHSEEIKLYLREAGFSTDDHDWLAKVFKHPDYFGTPRPSPRVREDFANEFKDLVDVISEISSKPIQNETDRQTFLALLFGSLLGTGPYHALQAKSENAAWIGEFRGHAAFCAKKLDWPKLTQLKSRWFDLHKLLPYIFPKGISLAEFVDLDFDSDTFDDLYPYLVQEDVCLEQIIDVAFSKKSLRQEWAINGFKCLVKRFHSDWRPSKNLDLRSITDIEQYKEQRRKRFGLQATFNQFSGLPADILSTEIIALLDVLEYVLDISDYQTHRWICVADELSPFLELLNDKQTELKQRHSALVKAWWRLSRIVYLGTNKPPSDGLRERLVDSAVEHLGILQKLLKDTPEKFKDKDSTGVPISDFYDEAFKILYLFASPWECLRPLLLVFTEMTMPAVPYDLNHLRCWPEAEKECPVNINLLCLPKSLRDEGESPLKPYCKIPLWVEDAIWRREEAYGRPLENDTDWDRLCEEFAKFCLEQLELETRTLWQQHYVKALGRLRLDLGGRKLETLRQLYGNNLDEAIREAAKEGVQLSLAEFHANPQYPLLETFWWLRQAHRLTLRPCRTDSEVALVMQVTQYFADAGCLTADQAWLVQVLQRPDCLGDLYGKRVFKPGIEEKLPEILQQLKELAQIGGGGQTFLTVFFSFLLGFGPVNSKVVTPNVPLKDSSGDGCNTAWMDKFRKYAKFDAPNIDWRKLGEIEDAHSLQLTRLIPFLFPKGIPLDRIVDLELLDSRPRQRSDKDFKNPEMLEYWLIRKFRSHQCSRTIKLDALTQTFSGFRVEILGDKTLGLLNAVRCAWNKANNKPGDEAVVGDELLPFLDLLNGKQPEASQDRSSVLRAWWRLSVATSQEYGYWHSKTSLRNKLEKSAARYIGVLRSLLRETPEDFEGEDASGPVSDFYEEAFQVLLVHGAPWECLKPPLLAFTAMTVKAVASDLRFWDEPERETIPHPYSKIPLWIGKAMYPHKLRDELKKDPHLQALREEWAKFSLSRLKTRKSGIANRNEDFVEPRPEWRAAYVQALTALRVNPGGRAHRTLFWLSQHDPNVNVRKFAKTAHRQIRHLDRKKSNLDDGASPRRPLFESFWWLRQAHLRSLKIDIDSAGAMRTRRKELHRTRETDDRVYWGDDSYTNRFATK